VAARYGVAVDKVLIWIANGELRAVNIATRPTGRPRWAIGEDDLAEFEQARAAVPPRRASRQPRPSVKTERRYF
jgi:hypothetical protein